MPEHVFAAILVHRLDQLADTAFRGCEVHAHANCTISATSIVLFGPETPSLYGSLGNTESITVSLACSPCVTAANQKNSACDDAVCMRLITPERVLQSIQAVLDGELDRTSDLVQVAVARR